MKNENTKYLFSLGKSAAIGFALPFVILLTVLWAVFIRS
jgi:hypothetical protein